MIAILMIATIWIRTRPRNAHLSTGDKLQICLLLYSINNPLVEPLAFHGLHVSYGRAGGLRSSRGGDAPIPDGWTKAEDRLLTKGEKKR